MSLQNEVEKQFENKKSRKDEPVEKDKQAGFSDNDFREISLLDTEKCLYKDWRLIAFLIGIFIFVLLSRFIRLDFKPPMHDECMFFFYSNMGLKYNYMPILHGPLVMFMSSFVYTLLGVTDYTIRLAVTVITITVFGLLWGMRRNLGVKGLIFAFIFFAFSPTLMYYSRFWRNDIPLTVFNVGALFCFLRFLETGKGRFIVAAILFCTSGFCTMENSIFFYFNFFVFFFIWFFTTFIVGIMQREKSKKPIPFSIAKVFEPQVLFISIPVVIIIAILKLIVFYKTFEGIIIKDFKVKEFITFQSPFKYYAASSVSFIIAIIVFSLIVYAIKNRVGKDQEISRLWNVLSKNWLSISIGLIAGFFMYMTLFTTFFHNNIGGPFKIYRDTFAYWWGQHAEHRIRGAYHYYMPILLLYEFLPIFIVLAGVAFSLIKEKSLKIKTYIFGVFGILFLIVASVFSSLGGPSHQEFWQKMDKVLHIQNSIHIYLIFIIGYFGMIQTIRYIIKKEVLLSFVFFWTWIGLLQYSYAGEKVPWVSAHIAVPLFLTAAIYCRKLLESDFYARSKKVLIPIFSILLFLTFLTGMRLCFVQPWSVSERLVYGHTTMQVQYAAHEIRNISRLLDSGKDTPINVEAGLLVNWPLRWYLPGYTKLMEIANPQTWDSPFVFVNWDKVKPDAAPGQRSDNIIQNYYLTKVTMLQWWQPPIPDFALMMKVFYVFIPEDSLNSNQQQKTDYENAKKEWSKVYRYLVYRETFDALNAQWPTVSGQDCAFGIRKDIWERTRKPYYSTPEDYSKTYDAVEKVVEKTSK